MIDILISLIDILIYLLILRYINIVLELILSSSSCLQIYDCLDLIDAVVWPTDHMRANGGRLSWKDWEPSAGMVGYVVHVWVPNHKDVVFRSHVNHCVYLIEIGEHYVPVDELGLREYNQIVGSSSEEMANSRRSSIQRDFHEYNMQFKLAGVTPIVGSKSHKAKIRAVSSSSSEDEDEMVARCSTAKTKLAAAGAASTGVAAGPLLPGASCPAGIDLMNFNRLLSMWKLIADKKKQALTIDTSEPFAAFDYMGELPPELMRQLEESRLAQQRQQEEQEEEELRKHLQQLEDEALALAAEQAAMPVREIATPPSTEELSLEPSGSSTANSTPTTATTPEPLATAQPDEEESAELKTAEETARKEAEKTQQIADNEQKVEEENKQTTKEREDVKEEEPEAEAEKEEPEKEIEHDTISEAQSEQENGTTV